MGARSRNVLPSLLFHGGKDHDKKGTSEPVEADEGQHTGSNQMAGYAAILRKKSGGFGGGHSDGQGTQALKCQNTTVEAESSSKE